MFRSKVGATVAFAVMAAMSWSSDAAAQLADITVSDNSVETSVELLGFKIDVSVGYEDASGLTAESLGLSASIVNPTDAALLARLPSATAIGVPAALPVMITIDPPADGGLSFNGITTLELYTKNLHYTAGSPLRLFSAPKNGQFRDITDLNASGSYRTRGSKGNYSDFLIVADTRPLATVLDTKFSILENLLATHALAIGPSLRLSFETALDDAQSASQAGDFDSAIDAIEAFDRLVSTAADNGSIPETWAASGGPANVAGELRAVARTLRFSLTLGANGL